MSQTNTLTLPQPYPNLAHTLGEFKQYEISTNSLRGEQLAQVLETMQLHDPRFSTVRADVLTYFGEGAGTTADRDKPRIFDFVAADVSEKARVPTKSGDFDVPGLEEGNQVMVRFSKDKDYPFYTRVTLGQLSSDGFRDCILPQGQRLPNGTHSSSPPPPTRQHSTHFTPHCPITPPSHHPTTPPPPPTCRHPSIRQKGRRV